MVIFSLLGFLLNFAIPILIIVKIVKVIQSRSSSNTSSGSTYRQLTPEEFIAKSRSQAAQMKAHKSHDDQSVKDSVKTPKHHDHVYAPQAHDSIFNKKNHKEPSSMDIFGVEKKKHDPFNL